jgi:hypothetical protein
LACRLVADEALGADGDAGAGGLGGAVAVVAAVGADAAVHRLGVHGARGAHLGGAAVTDAHARVHACAVEADLVAATVLVDDAAVVAFDHRAVIAAGEGGDP